MKKVLVILLSIIGVVALILVGGVLYLDYNEQSQTEKWQAENRKRLDEQKAREKAETAAKEALKPKAPEFKFAKEDINDPAIYKEPRIQFVWTPPNRKKGETEVWSMSLNGDDLRQVASYEELMGDRPGEIPTFGITVVRSPDNRYLAYGIDPDRYERRVLDLKTRKQYVMAKETLGMPSFNWTKGSRYVYFKDANTIKKYDVKEHKLSQHPNNFRSPFFIYDNGNKVFHASGKKFIISNFQSGKTINEWEGKYKINYTLIKGSQYAKKFIYPTFEEKDRGVFSFLNPLDYKFGFIRKGKNFLGSAGRYMFTVKMEDEVLFLFKTDLNSNETTRLSSLPNSGPVIYNYTIFNVK